MVAEKTGKWYAAMRAHSVTQYPLITHSLMPLEHFLIFNIIGALQLEFRIDAVQGQRHRIRQAGDDLLKQCRWPDDRKSARFRRLEARGHCRRWNLDGGAAFTAQSSRRAEMKTHAQKLQILQKRPRFLLEIRPMRQALQGKRP